MVQLELSVETVTRKKRKREKKRKGETLINTAYVQEKKKTSCLLSLHQTRKGKKKKGDQMIHG